MALSLPVDTVVTGERTDPPLSVRVEDALGNPVEGAPVRFILLRGEGRLSPGVAVSGIDGVAESSFQAAAAPGVAAVRADIPSAPHVPAIEFEILAQASDTVLLSIVEGDGQRAEVGSQLAIPFRVAARTPSGNPAGGISVVFRISAGGDASAVLTADSVLTDGEGVASTVLTLGREAGNYEVAAFASRGVQSDTVRFAATATATFDGSVVLDSIGGGVLVTGGEATVFGRGFSPIPSENDVRIEGTPALVLEAGGTELTIRVPDFSGACLPRREVGVRVLVQGDASNGRMIVLDPEVPALDLAVGEVARLRDPEAVACLQFGPGTAPREYRIAVGSSARSADGSIRMRLETHAPSTSPSAGLAASIAPRDFAGAVQDAIRQRARPDMVLRARALQSLRRGRIRPARPRTRVNRAPATRVPAAGDTLTHRFAVQSDFSASCADTTTTVRGIVRAVGEHVVLVEDVRAPGGGPEAEDWAALSAELDDIVVPVDTAYFGGYEDLDGNGRVIVLFTPEVNGLSTPGAGGVGGFFLPLDLAAARAGGDGLAGPAGELCPASNEAEILYLVVADPEGAFGPTVTKPQALRNARGLVAHELQHLINAERRVLQGEGGFAAAEEVWLDEALSSIAEEVAGLAVIDASVGSNLTFDRVSTSRAELDAFNAYQINNFFNLSLYMFDPASAPTISTFDPAGAGGLQMRGFGWFFLRWLADQGGGDERVFFRDLVRGGPNANRGIENLERSTGRDWVDLLSDFAVALAADDSGIDALPDRFRILTWEFRDILASLNRNPAARSLFPIPFPLQTTSLRTETGAIEFDVRPSTVRYFSFVSGLDAPAVSLALSTPAGGRLSETTEPNITIVRTR